MDSTYFGVVPAFILLILWAVFIVRYRKDPRRLSNAILLFPLVLGSISLSINLLTSLVPGLGLVLVLVFLLAPLIYLVFAGALIHNGVVMWRREGPRISNLLSLVAGLAVLGLPVLAFAILSINTWWAYAFAFVLFMSSSLAACLFSMLLLYAWVQAKFPSKGQGAAVVVLGARTIKGKVTPLLRGRLDRGISLYETASEPKPLLVPSGGQGGDEVESEGVSMARYLQEQGIPEAQIMVEDQAKDTIQNLTFSDALVRQQKVEGRLWVVTSDYHAMRAGFASRQLGLDARAFGGKTAAYYRPSAFLRECVAIVRDHKLVVGLLALPFAAVVIGALVLLLNYDQVR
ncbi:YdcF family protein [Glutamicibacter sp. 363]|uniref:YdcF family protein n=1 Tax=unclassified Glutamicibacter TaxID=2627139 RepID=UPI004034EF30